MPKPRNKGPRGDVRDEIVTLDPNESHFDETIRLDRDLVQASRTMGDEEARYLVDAYYMTQENRKRTENQVRSLSGEPHVLIAWLADKNWKLESQIARALDAYTQSHMMGDWMRNIVGIGPVLTAGLLAHIYMGEWCHFCRGHDEADHTRRCAKPPKWATWPEDHDYTPERSQPTVGHIWQHAGYAADGQKPWEEGKIRPFNATLKVLCWKVGQSFMKLSNREDCYYGQIYRERKKYEILRNDAGMMAEAAARQLPHFRKTTESYKWYEKGMLPPAQIDARARRYAVKMFLSHMHHVWYSRMFDEEPPLPFAVVHLGHVHIKPPPFHEIRKKSAADD
jgi:hypothetical protein